MESDEKNKIDKVSASPPSAPREGTIYSARIEKFHRLFILYFMYRTVLGKRNGCLISG